MKTEVVNEAGEVVSHKATGSLFEDTLPQAVAAFQEIGRKQGAEVAEMQNQVIRKILDGKAVGDED
jgi:hypothetical protein